jgi:hypothetical protein
VQSLWIDILVVMYVLIACCGLIPNIAVRYPGTEEIASNDPAMWTWTTWGAHRPSEGGAPFGLTRVGGCERRPSRIGEWRVYKALLPACAWGRAGSRPRPHEEPNMTYAQPPTEPGLDPTHEPDEPTPPKPSAGPPT